MALAPVLFIALLTNAWVVDEAYITFRTVDNLFHGYGLRWNPDERVQAYTHPLWMFLFAGLYYFTAETFFTVLALSLVLTLASILVVWRAVTRGFRDALWKGPLLVLALLSSKAFIDFASSGLENPLSYLLVALFFTRLLGLRRRGASPTARDAGYFTLVASLALVNRIDSALVFLPGLALAVWKGRAGPMRRTGLAIFAGASPAILWLLFSVFYYGFPFPNTAYAKAICTGYPLAWQLRRGMEYLVNSLHWDSASWLIVSGAAWVSLRRKSPEALSLMAGLLLYIAFALESGAGATHMSGRFFAVPFFAAAILFVDGAMNPRFGVLAAVWLALYLIWSPVSSIKFGTPAYRPFPNRLNCQDTKWLVQTEGAALINWRPGLKMPDSEWFRYGEEIRNTPGKAHVGGAFGREAIGYACYAAGPGKHFIDYVALSDPLLARLPAQRPREFKDWKSGHFYRSIPEGYVESIESGENRVRDARLREYYEAIRTMTRGPLFSGHRLRVIVEMNLGRYDRLLVGVTGEP